MSRQRASTLVEFAIAWPVVLLLTMGAIEMGLWSALASGTRTAALAGARAGAVAGGSSDGAAGVALAALRPVAFGTRPAAWCPGAAPEPAIWVCARDLGSAMEVVVGGQAPALVPLLPAAALPVHADVTVTRERYT